MYQFYIRLAILFLMVSLGVSMYAQNQETLAKSIDKITRYDTKIKDKDIPGYIIGVIDADSTYIFSYGTLRKGKDLPLNDSTIFELGSFTKVFTLALVNKLVADSVLTYEDKLNSFLPDDLQNPAGDWISIADLLSHTSGLSRMPKDFGLKEKDPRNPYQYYTKEDLLVYYATCDIGEQVYVYSDTNFALLEIALEFLTGKSYRELMREEVINPLALTDTHFATNEKFKSRMSWGYSIAGIELPPWQYASFEGSMGIRSSLRDVLTFVKTNIGLSNYPYQAIFQDNFNKITDTGIEKNISVGRTWHLIERKRYNDIIVHPGRTDGHQITCHFVPETQTAVVILANSEASLDNLGFLILGMLNDSWRKARTSRNKS